MGIFKSLSDKAKLIFENYSTSTEAVQNNYDFNNKLINYQKDKFNKSQVIALFLQSMSYRPHKIGKNNDDDYPRYLTYEYNILDVPGFHKEMIENGYFKKADFKNIIKRYKVDELKELLINKNDNIKKLKKEELIELVIKLLSDDEKLKIVEESGMYELSEEGLIYLEKYKDFLKIVDLKKYCISFSLFIEYREKLPAYSTIRDVAWHILNERLNYYERRQQFGMYRNVYMHMAQFLEEEKRTIDTLYYNILILYYDVNLAYVQYDMANHLFDKKVLLNMLQRNILASAIIAKIKELADLHNDSIFEKLFRYDNLPYKFISNDEFKEMIFEIYNSSFFDESKYIDIILNNATKAINRL